MLKSPSISVFCTSSTEHLSPAQRCNEDVLRHIITHLSRADVTSSCLVYRGWVDTCRQELYSTVVFKSLRDSEHCIPCLSWTLYNSPVIRGHVRHLTISPWKIFEADRFNWIPLLASKGYLRTLILSHGAASEHFEAAWSFTPPFLTVKHVSLRARTMRNCEMTLQDVLKKFPNVESFALDLRYPADSFLPVPVPTSTTRRLTLDASEHRVSTLIPFLSTLVTTLTHLDIKFDTEDDEASFIPVPLRMTNLVHLAILMRRVPDSRPPFLDSVVPSLPHLRELSCPTRSYSSAFLRQLPAQIEMLWLGCLFSDNLDVPAFEEMIERVTAGKSALKWLCLVNGVFLEEGDFERIGMACHAAGTTLKYDTITGHHYEELCSVMY